MIKKVCDFCGVEVFDEYKLIIKSGEKEMSNMDVCDECYEEIKKMLDKLYLTKFYK